MSRERPEDYSIQHWLAEISDKFEGKMSSEIEAVWKLVGMKEAYIELLESRADPWLGKARPPLWEMRHRLQESIADTIVETVDLAAFLAELQDAGVVEAWIRDMLEDRSPIRITNYGD